MKKAICCVALCALAACSGDDDRVTFDGQYFKGRLDADKDSPKKFVASVSPVGGSLDGAREAARYEGTKYCIAQYGNSYITWINGPDAEEAELQIADGTLTVTGMCQG